MNFESILIVTYGRSGSTLLQGLLNSIDECLIRGENNNFCIGLFQAYRSLLSARASYGGTLSREPTNPWFGIGETMPEKFIEDASLLVRNQLLGGRSPESVKCLGFKEIRYPGVKELAAYLDFLGKVFPKPAFIFLTRDHASVAQSAWWRSRPPELVGKELGEFEAAILEWSRERETLFRIDYTEMVANGRRLQEMFAFLGAEYDADTVGRILDLPHSYSPPEKQSFGEGRRVLPAPENSVTGIDVRHFSADIAATWSDSGGVRRMGGLLLLNSAMPPSDLQARCGERVLSCEWGLPSPRLAKEFPQIPAAGKSRFRVDVTTCKPGEKVDLFMVASDGAVSILGTMAVPGLPSG